MNDAVIDAWSKRYPVSFAIGDSAESLERWRQMCRDEQRRTGRVVAFIAKPFDPDNIPVDRSRVAENHWDVNGSDWSGNGRLGGMGARK
jgi:hypothetical protein